MLSRSGVVASLMVCAFPSLALAEDSAPDWRALATADVQAAYVETRDNHPGMFDPKNRKFPKLLEMARVEALKLASEATSAAGFEASLTRFKAVLNDGHAGAYASLPDTNAPQIKWPGFVAAWRGNAMYVFKSAPGGPPEGAQILSCDKLPVNVLVERNYFRFADGREVPGNWWSSARRLFVDDGNPFVTLPGICLFRHSGKNQSRKLSWSAVPDYYQAWKNGSANGDLLPIGMTERAPGIFWYALPDFQPDDAGTVAYKKMYADTAANRDKLLGARAIVLDLRFNQGGSSNWSKMLAKQLWGDARVDRRLKDYFAKTQTWWRPTAGNLAAVKEFIPLLEQQGDPESAAMVKMFLPIFEGAVTRGDTYLIEPDIPEGEVAATALEPVELKTPIYVIVSGQCASACLDAVDYFKRFPNTKLIGAPSGADSTYMEVRNPKLPSGMAYAIIPMKMYVDRPRGKGVFYQPDIEMRDFDWSTANFLKRIEADLANKRNGPAAH
jgi:Peptidase family S41